MKLVLHSIIIYRIFYPVCFSTLKILLWAFSYFVKYSLKTVVSEASENLQSSIFPSHSLRSCQQDDDYLATLKELEATLRTQSLSLEVIPEGKIMNNTYYQECLFYLHNYSTNLAIISFYVRHNCLREALLHLLNKVGHRDTALQGHCLLCPPMLAHSALSGGDNNLTLNLVLSYEITSGRVRSDGKFCLYKSWFDECATSL